MIGHRGFYAAAGGVSFMHYECELAVVIGKPAHKVRAAPCSMWRATRCVTTTPSATTSRTGTVQPARKNRDGGTVLGPWLVDAEDVPQPHDLACARW